MVTLTTDLGEFSGENEKEVLKLARKAKQEAKKKEEIDNVNYQKATLEAYRNAYYLYNRKAHDEEWPGGWGIAYPSNLNEGAIKRDTYGDEMCYWGLGCAKFKHNGYRVFAVLEGSSGLHMAVWLKDIDGDAIEMYAIGVCEDQVNLVQMYGFQPEDFRERGQK